MNIGKTNEQARKGITMLVYGDSGTGKTTLLGTIADPNTLIIDVEGGLSVLRDKTFDTVRVSEDLANLKEVFDHLQNGLKHTTICLDSATELEAFMIAQLSKIKNREKPTLDEYGAAAYKMRQYMRVLRDLRDKGVNVVITALETPMDLEQGSGVTRTKMYPLMMKKLAPEVAGLFDIVARMKVSVKEGSKGTRFLLLDGTENELAKTRYRMEKPWFEADLGKLFATVCKQADGNGKTQVEPAPTTPGGIGGAQ